MSRVTDGIARQRLDAEIVRRPDALRRRRDRSPRRRPRRRRQPVALGDGRRELPEHADARAVARDRRGASPGTSHGSRMRLGRVDRRASGLADALDDALHVEEVDVARAAAPVLGAGGAGPRARHARAVRRRLARTGRRSRTAARRAARAGGCARPRRRGRAAPTAAAPRSSPTAGSRSATRSPSAANGAAAASRDEAERDRLGETRRRSGSRAAARACGMRGSIGGGAAVSAGNVTGMRSKP